ncbi:MAG: aminopeptidase N, partial [Nonlabens sp.]
MKGITIIALLVAFISQSQNTSSQLELVDFQKAQVVISLDESSNEVKGEILFDLKILKDASSIFIDAKNLVAYQAFLDNKEVKTIYDGEKLVVQSSFSASDNQQLKVMFTSYPSKAMYHIDEDNDR